MKRSPFLLIILVLMLAAAGQLGAQDAATEERLNKLSGQIENLVEAQRAQQKHIEALAREIEGLRDQLNKPAGNFATPDDLKRVSEAIKDVDRKRMEDAEKVSATLERLRKTLSGAPPPSPKKGSSGAGSADTSNPQKNGKDEEGYPYTIKSGDTLSIIVQAYRDQNIKVTTDSILKANPGLKPEKLKVGQKIWIPKPQS